ncbi:MAG: phage tail protein, partial [Acidimicrobiales bacterium]
MAVEVGTAYVRIMPSAQGFRRNLERELGGELATSGQTQGKRFGSGLIAGAATALKGAAVGVGVGVGVALSAGLVKGFGRLSAIEQAEAKLNGLGHSARAISRIMDNALKSVQGTAFGLDEAASVAASAVAAGIKPGKELFG